MLCMYYFIDPDYLSTLYPAFRNMKFCSENFVILFLKGDPIAFGIQIEALFLFSF